MGGLLISLKRIPELDALRGGAALGVVVFHAYPHGLFWAWSLVDLFFVLSGFLITRILLKPECSRPRQVGRFWISRIFRIWPVYYLVLSAIMLKYWLSQQVGTTPEGLPGNFIASLLFVQNYSIFWAPAGHIPGFDHSWSLAVEEQFYLLWPFVVLLLRSRPRLLISLCFALIMAGIVSRIFLANGTLLVTRMDGLVIGALLACIELPQLSAAKQAKWLGICSVLAVGAASYVLTRYLVTIYAVPGDRSGLMFTLRWPALVASFAVIYGALVWILIRNTGASWLVLLRSRVFTYLASISYAVYMVHFPILWALLGLHSRYSIDWQWWSTIMLLATSIGTAHLLREWIERPMQSWKRRQLIVTNR